MNTKLLLLTGLATGIALQLCPTALAAPITYTGSASPDVVIPDNNLSGVASTIVVPSDGFSEITTVTLTLNIIGDPTAYNGDYYAYLQNSSGLLMLMSNIDNPPAIPYGSTGNGINVTLADGNPNIGTAPYGVNAPLTGTYAPQGGSLDATFGGNISPEGDWTLFIADTSPGGVGELANWSLTVNGVPDNGSTMMLLGMGVGFLGLCSLRQFRTAPVSRD